MNRKVIIRLLIAIPGLIFIVASVFASQFGLDNDPGWGVGRLRMLIVGLCAFIFGVSYWFVPALNRGWVLVKDTLQQVPAIKFLNNAWGQLKTKIGDFVGKYYIPLVDRLQDIRFYRWLSAYKADIFLTLTVCFFLWLYIWVITIGKMDKFPLGWDYYSLLSQGFQKGQTFLPVEPSPELMKLSNPYDHAQLNNVRYMWDVVYFKGKYFLYWGPVPAVLGLIVSFLTSRPVPDSELVFIFVTGIALFSILIFRDICRDWQFPSWVLVGGVLVSAINIPLIWLLNRPAVYEAAISGGQFFMMAGFFALYRAFRTSFPHKTYLLFASISFGLAWTSRLNLFPSVAFLACVLLLRIYTANQNKLKTSISSFLVVVIPLVAIGSLMAWYNYVRFGSVFEFGHKYQLTVAADYKEIYSLKYIIPNAYTYIFRTPILDSSFPFITIPALNLKNAFPAFIHIPEHYPHPAPVAGLLIIFPVIGLVVLLAIRWLWLFINGDLVYVKGKKIVERSLLNWFSFSAFGCGAIQIILLLIFQYSSIRYMVDFTPIFVLLAVIFMGFYARFVERNPNYLKLIAWLWIIGSLLTVLAGFFINFTAEENIFMTKNPQLYAQFVEWFRFH